MPTYTYRCLKCGHEFERLQSMSDEPVKRCPECKSKVQRVIHPVGIVLKGSGFHRNDYRKKDESRGETKSETKSETKTETTSETKSSDTKSDKSEKSEKSEKKGD